MPLLFSTLYMLVIAFLPRSKHLLISWLQSPSAVILEPPKNKISHSFHCFPIYLPWSEGTGLVAMILAFWMLSFKPTFSLSFTFIKRLSSSSLLSVIRVVSSAYLRLLIFLPAILIPACASFSPVFLMMNPTPVFLPGESHGRRSLVGYSPWGRKESDTTEPLHFTSLYI